MKCYEIKNCVFNGKDHKESKCPPHKLQVGCWEYDWVSYYNEMPDCEEKLEWRDFMINNCTKCKIYELHKNEVDNFLEGLRNS